MRKIREVVQTLQEHNDRALIPFIMSGLPDESLCLDCIMALEQGGCDMLELGVPFTDPLADGETIERFHHRGVAKGLNLLKGLEFAHRIKDVSSLPLILFSYFNPIYKMGVDLFAKESRSAGIEAVIIPDMPLEEINVLCNNIEVIPMVAPNSADERMKMAAGFDPLFIYCVSVRGVTGMRNSLPEAEITNYLQRVGEATRTPRAMGFGISSPKQVKTFRDYAEAFVVGSFLGQLIEDNEHRPGLLPGIMEKTAGDFKAVMKK